MPLTLDSKSTASTKNLLKKLVVLPNNVGRKEYCCSWDPLAIYHNYVYRVSPKTSLSVYPSLGDLSRKRDCSFKGSILLLRIRIPENGIESIGRALFCYVPNWFHAFPIKLLSSVMA